MGAGERALEVEVRINAQAVQFDKDAILASDEAKAVFEEIRADLKPPLVASARWSLLSHRPLPGAEDRYVTTYTVNLAVDGLGIMPDEYLAHDGDMTPEFDLKTLFESVAERAKGTEWRGRIEVSFQLASGMLFDIRLRIPDDLPGTWTATIDPPPDGVVATAEDLRKLMRQRRRITLVGEFSSPDEIPKGNVTGRLGIINSALVDTPCEIEAGWPVSVNLTRYEWEDEK